MVGISFDTRYSKCCIIVAEGEPVNLCIDGGVRGGRPSEVIAIEG